MRLSQEARARRANARISGRGGGGGGARGRRQDTTTPTKRRRFSKAAAPKSVEDGDEYNTDLLISNPFLPPPPARIIEADIGLDPGVDAQLNADVRALRKTTKLTFDRFEIRSLSAARMAAIRLPDIAQASRSKTVHEAERQMRLRRTAQLLEQSSFATKAQLDEVQYLSQPPIASTSKVSLPSTSTSSLPGKTKRGRFGPKSRQQADQPTGPSVWDSDDIVSSLSHHRTMWLAWVMEHERGTAEITLSNNIDNEPCPPWDWCYTDEYILSNLTRQEDDDNESAAGPPLRGCSCNDDSCDPATCECFARLKVIDPITWSAETDFAYNQLGRLRKGHFAQCVILECNDACGCSASCRNRLVQHGRTVPLDIFKTAHCGWGVRAKSQIPKNSFIAAYAGELIDVKGMHERGKKYSKTATTYQLDIDSFHIRCLTRIGPFNEWREQQGLAPMDPAREETYAAAVDWWAEHDPDHVDPIMTVDAGLWGNLTRYFNHSCDPNMELYPVYTDSQDLMRPYLAFFAKRDIPAGQELRFSYNGDLADDTEADTGLTAAAGVQTKDPTPSVQTTLEQKTQTKEKRRQTLLHHSDGASRTKKLHAQDQGLAGLDAGDNRDSPSQSTAVGKKSNSQRTTASTGAPRNASSVMSTPTPSSSQAKPTASTVQTMMAELVPSGSREVELVDGVKAMVCRCGAPKCRGQVFA